MIVGVVIIPIVTPINALATNNSIKKSFTSLRLENPIKSQEAIPIMVTNNRVFRRPIFSARYADSRLPMGLVIGVIDANHEISDVVNATSSSDFDSSCVVIAG